MFAATAMKSAHRGMGITAADFNALVEDLLDLERLRLLRGRVDREGDDDW